MQLLIEDGVQVFEDRFGAELGGLKINYKK